MSPEAQAQYQEAVRIFTKPLTDSEVLAAEGMERYIQERILAERERCAKIAEDYFDRSEDRACGDLIAEKIRKGE